MYIRKFITHQCVVLFSANGESVLFKTRNLNELELFQLFNKHITTLAPKEEANATEVKTKTATAGKKGKKK